MVILKMINLAVLIELIWNFLDDCQYSINHTTGLANQVTRLSDDKAHCTPEQLYTRTVSPPPPCHHSDKQLILTILSNFLVRLYYYYYSHLSINYLLIFL